MTRAGKDAAGADAPPVPSPTPAPSPFHAPCGHEVAFTPRQKALGWAGFLLLAGGLAWALTTGAEGLGYNWQWYRVGRYFLAPGPNGIMDGIMDGLTAGPLLRGLGVTLEITAASFGLSFALGLGCAVLRLSPSPVGRGAARVYLELVRNTPLLIQLFFLYFAIAPLFGLSAFATAVLSLSLFEGAYASEIFRAGIVAVDRGQWEAALGTGLNLAQTYRHVILPQAVRRILPPLAGQAVSLVKDSALVSTIAVYDLTMQGQAIVAETFLTFEIWFTVAAVYLCVTLALDAAVGLLRRALAGPVCP
ncbi:MAG: amino acid ABC transporter permease [Desulfovibrionaceae bacterium]